MTIREVQSEMRYRLTPKYGLGEAEAITELAMEEVFRRNRVDLLLSLDKDAGEERPAMLEKIIARLLDGEPIQYILGYETFMGIRLNVTPAVLIPRPETEQLVSLVVEREGRTEDLRILDAGTGSGAIAIALLRNLRFPIVTAIEISENALEVARANAARLHARIDFVQADMLAMGVGIFGPFDVIVSNPPYVLESEKNSMEDNVLGHEPERAIFVPDTDPLRFYRALAQFAAAGGVVKGGRIYFECNPLTVDSLADELVKLGFTSVDVVRDSFGKRRFITAKLAERL